MKNGLVEWLKSDEGKSVLFQCSYDIVFKAQKGSINLEHIFNDMVSPGTSELQQIIASELVTFLLEHQTAVVNDISADQAAGDISAVSAKITTKFFKHILDKRRTYPVSPFHAYHRHLREIISKAGEAGSLRYLPTDYGSYFAYSTKEALDFLPHSYWGQAFDGWASPALSHTDAEVQAGMLFLSRFYWDEATIRYETEYLHPLKELTRFIFAKYSFLAQRQELGSDNGEDGSRDRTLDQMKPVQLAGDPLGSLTRQSERLDYDIIETELSDLAEKCAEGLEEKQIEALLLAADGENLSEIARRTGETRHIAEKHLKSAQTHILRFWSLWGNAQLPGFAAEDEEEQLIFIEKIVQICKKHHGGRVGI